MNDHETRSIIEEYLDFIRVSAFPCIAAKAALSKDQIETLVVGHLACPKDDAEILDFLYRFVDRYRDARERYHSAVIIFKGPENCSEKTFDDLLWKRLQSISDLDASAHDWDPRVGKEAMSPDFSFSIKGEAFYIIGLHANSSRKARRFRFPALVFNPHEQFEALRASDKYSAMKEAVRKRDKIFSGSVNPMLADFGESSEVLQYSGRRYDNTWTCPFIAKHEDAKHHSGS